MRRIPEEIFRIQRRGAVSLQAQIRETVVAGVVADHLRPGDRLPSTRALARYLGVSRATAALAYEELAVQGFLEARPRSGWRVSERAPLQRSDVPARPPAGCEPDWQRHLVRRYRGSYRPVTRPADWRRYPYPFVYGQVDLDLFDLNAWRDCARRALGRADFAFSAGDLAAADDPMLIEVLATRILPRRGIRAGPSAILVTAGAQNAL